MGCWKLGDIIINTIFILPQDRPRLVTNVYIDNEKVCDNLLMNAYRINKEEWGNATINIKATFCDIID